MQDSPISLVSDGNWPSLIKASFPSEAQSAVGEDLIALLRANGDAIQALYDQYEAQAEETSASRMGAYFPTAESPTHKPLEQIPNLTRALITALYVRRRMDTYVEWTAQDARALRSYVQTTDDAYGRRLYDWLYKGRDSDYLNEAVADTLKNPKEELTGYENEMRGIKSFGLGNSGLSTRKAIDCLDDFSGRTFPFIRATCEASTTADSVLDIGTGTGILAATAAIGAPDTVVGIEVNPLTALLAREIVDDLELNNLIPEDTVDILWGDALRFGAGEHMDYAQQFEVVISENISTGLFYEPQTQSIQHARNTGLVTEDANIVPNAVASGVELVSLNDEYTPKAPAETLLLVDENGGRVEDVITRTVPYDYVDLTADPPSNIIATVREGALTDSTVDALLLHSIVKLGETDYVKRNQSGFLNHDLVLHLSSPVDAVVSDDLTIGMAYSYGEPAEAGIFEVYHGETDGEPDARLAVSEDQHAENKQRFKQRHGFQPDDSLDLEQLLMDERIRCRRARDGLQDVWRQARE